MSLAGSSQDQFAGAHQQTSAGQNSGEVSGAYGQEPTTPNWWPQDATAITENIGMENDGEDFGADYYRSLAVEDASAPEQPIQLQGSFGVDAVSEVDEETGTQIPREPPEMQSAADFLNPFSWNLPQGDNPAYNIDSVRVESPSAAQADLRNFFTEEPDAGVAPETQEEQEMVNMMNQDLETLPSGAVLFEADVHQERTLLDVQDGSSAWVTPVLGDDPGDWSSESEDGIV